MTTESGHCPSGRAAAADAVEPSSTVSSKAGIPNAEWIDHSEGGGCPLQSNTLVRVQFRDGMVSEIDRASLWWMTKDQGRSLWIHRGRPNDIVAYWIADPELRASAIEAPSGGETVKQGSTEGESAGRQASPGHPIPTDTPRR